MTLTDQQRAGRRSKRRGQNGELEVRDLVRAHGWGDATRTFMSGGQGGGDVGGIPDVHLEVKFVERLDLPGAWRQANASARPTDLIVIVHRCNFQPWIATLRLTDLMSHPHPGLGWQPMVIGPRASLRAEFHNLARTNPHPLVVHQVAAEAMASVLFEDLLKLLQKGKHP